jgi:hypothetical protein
MIDFASSSKAFRFLARSSAANVFISGQLSRAPKTSEICLIDTETCSKLWVLAELVERKSEGNQA